MTVLLSDDQTRMVSDEHGVFAFVGYVGSVENGRFVGRHAGCFNEPEKAEAWLRGDEVKPDLTIYGAS